VTAIVAAPVADGVQLTVTPADVTVTRLDANGLRVVRRPASAPTTWIDYEAPLRGLVRYLAMDSAGSDASTEVTAAGVGPQVRRVFDPTVKVSPVVETMTAGTTLTATEHTILGRADLVFTTYGMGKRRGTLSYACSTYAETVALRKLYADGAAVLLRMPEYAASDLYHIGTLKDDAPNDAAPVPSSGTQQKWTVTLTYAEVEPSALTTVDAWLLRDVDARYLTIAQASLPYATLADLDARTERAT